MVKMKENFSKSFDELERIVATFEGGKIDLDVALDEFARGMKLVQELKERLKEVENKVVVLKKKFGDLDAQKPNDEVSMRED